MEEDGPILPGDEYFDMSGGSGISKDVTNRGPVPNVLTGMFGSDADDRLD